MTPVRHVRVPDELWDAADAKAKAEFRSIADVIRECLRNYVSPPGRSRAARFEGLGPVEVDVEAAEAWIAASGAEQAKRDACTHPGVGRKMRCPKCRRYNL